jgi:hypothetical protein
VPVSVPSPVPVEVPSIPPLSPLSVPDPPELVVSWLESPSSVVESPQANRLKPATRAIAVSFGFGAEEIANGTPQKGHPFSLAR